MQFVCGFKCANEYARKQAVKNNVKSTLKRHKDLKKIVREGNIEIHKKTAQAYCNEYIRKRDNKLPCISCGTKTAHSFHASHYFDAGQFSGLRYDETNLHKSCGYCNTHKHGNKTGYRLGLIERYGIDYVDKLEAQKETGRNKKWSRIELEEIKLYFTQKTKSL